MISRESLAELNRRLPAPIPMARFRPNVVIEGVGGTTRKTRWSAFRFGKIVLRGVKHCTRCSITTTDQKTVRAIRARNRCARSGPIATTQVLHGVTFGQNCVVAEGVGEMLAVGAPLSFEAHQV